ncbi:MAG: hypothetical protein E7632_12195, partial [Ruminococcaceae bacterium]|nr:hypothetical protein [Oscillospiraceae bacterium]
MKKTISLFLAALMLAIPLAACSKDAAAGDDTASADTTVSADITASEDSAVPAETTPAVTGRKDAKDGIPADFSMNGKTVTCFTRSSGRKYDWDGGEEWTGDVLLEAVHKRVETVSERLKASLVCLLGPANWKEFGNAMEQNVMAGDGVVQIAVTPANASIKSGRDFLFCAMQDNKYLDFEQPWWNLAAIEELSLDGVNIRYMSGDMLLSQFNNHGAVYFNKDLYENNGFKSEDLYQTVIDRKWTLDELRKQATAMYKDVNGDGIEDDGDVYGFSLFTLERIKQFDYGFDIKRFIRNEQGYPVISYDTDRAETAVNKLNTLLHDTKGVKYEQENIENFFVNGNTVFWGDLLGTMHT